MRSFLFWLIICSVNSIGIQATDTEAKFRDMVGEVKAAVQGDTPNLKELEGIITRYFNMDIICTNVAKSYLLQKTKGKDADAKKSFVGIFLESFKPVYTSYLARVWTADSNRETFREYDLKSCQVKGSDVRMTFKNKEDQNSYIILMIDDKGLITSIKFGKDRQNMVDPISADSGSCAAGVSDGKKPQDIFSSQK